MAPSRQSTDKYQDQYDQQYGSDSHDISFALFHDVCRSAIQQ
jgi:hypothetical protein